MRGMAQFSWHPCAKYSPFMKLLLQALAVNQCCKTHAIDDACSFVQIADDMYPPFILTQILIALAKVLPKSKLVPQKDLAELAFREKKEMVSYLFLGSYMLFLPIYSDL